MAKADSRKLVTYWHKKLGIFSALILIFLSVTGVLLNHAHHLRLDSNDVNTPFLLELYGVKLPEVTAVELSHNWLSHQEGVLFFGYDEFGQCRGDFVGAVSLPEYWVAGCSKELQLFTYSNQLIEKVSVLQGLPQPVESIGVCLDGLCVSDGQTAFRFDDEEFTWAPVNYSSGEHLVWSELTVPPLHVLAQVQSSRHGGEITWERVVMDLHAGRFLGSMGPLFMDLSALMFIVLAISGVILWSKKSRRTTRRAQKTGRSKQG